MTEGILVNLLDIDPEQMTPINRESLRRIQGFMVLMSAAETPKPA